WVWGGERAVGGVEVIDGRKRVFPTRIGETFADIFLRHEFPDRRNVLDHMSITVDDLILGRRTHLVLRCITFLGNRFDIISLHRNRGRRPDVALSIAVTVWSLTGGYPDVRHRSPVVCQRRSSRAVTKTLNSD